MSRRRTEPSSLTVSLRRVRVRRPFRLQFARTAGLGIALALLSGPATLAQPTGPATDGPTPSVVGPRVRTKPARVFRIHESGRWLLPVSRPAGIDLSRPLPITRESLPVHLPDDE
jgi:hypothetical protein